MRLVNYTLYDTLILRRIVTAVYRFTHGAVRTPEFGRMRVYVLYAGAKAKKLTPGGWQLILRLPKLTGDEWVHLQRQAHGIESDPTADQGPPFTWLVGRQVAGLLGYGWQGSNTVFEKSDHIPRLLPLKPIKPPPPPVDKRAQRLQRIMELERGWQRKAKLAATKLKKLGRMRKRYERQLKEAP